MPNQTALITGASSGATRFAETAGMTETRRFQRAAMAAADVARIGYDGWSRAR